MPKPKAWRNRIVETGIAPAQSFLANEKNWRIHPKDQQDALGGVLREVGWVQQVVVNRRTAEEWGHNRGVETMVDGHLRVAMALSEGDDTPVPVTYVDLAPNEEALVLATLDPLAAMAATDKDQLDALLREVSPGDADLMKMLSDFAEREGVGGHESNEFIAEEEQWNSCPECGYRWLA